MSASDPDSSEVSNSPKSYMDMDSPYSSPSQQVPQLTNFLTELTCIDGNYVQGVIGTQPMLRIVEQPQNYFRFRYKSEMVGTHGCLLGKSYVSNKTKTHPTVELVNYSGQALIRCRLAHENSNKEHPHKLLDEDQVRDVSKEVPEDGSYKVAFPGLGIIHTAKKDVPALLYAKYASTTQNFNPRELHARCENEAKITNLNIVRLMFTAEDSTGAQICPPVFSEPIHNMKSAATNDLKICRMSRITGKPRGGDDVFILVEKVNKKNIDVRFFEMSDDGREVWSEKAKFLQSDVHHQYAIVFRTPQYHNPQISTDVKVQVELVRPSDGRTSDSKEFTYKAEQIFKQSKKRKTTSSFSSIGSSSDGSIKSIGLPTTVLPFNQNMNGLDEDMGDVTMYSTAGFVSPNQPIGHIDLGDALYTEAADSKLGLIETGVSPVLSQPNVPGIPSISLNSAEFERLLKDNPSISQEEKQQLLETNFNEYFLESYGLSNAELLAGTSFVQEQMGTQLDKLGEPRTNSMIIRSNLRSDSGRGKNHSDECKKAKLVNTKDKEYSARYKNEDGIAVKQLVKDICEMIRKKGSKKQEVRAKLERLFEIRLSNGDTFLHMTLCNNQSSLDVIVKIIHTMKMPHLLNLVNNNHQSILHLAVIHNMPQIVDFLLSKGCDPMLRDPEGNTVVHFAVYCQTCVKPLLDAIKKNNVPCDINAENIEEETALHLAAIHNSPSSAEQLLQHGADYSVMDNKGRTPLHLAAYDDCLAVARVLLEFIPDRDVDIVDKRGLTPLQIVCGGTITKNSLEFLKLLLKKNANPLKHDENNQSAWKLSQDKPDMKELLQPYAPLDAIYDEDVKSEPEDEYESADDGEETNASLQELPLYIRELSVVLDSSNAWEELATRLHYESLLNWFRNQPSPTKTLLNHIKECNDGVSSKSLAMTLVDIGQLDAANIITSHIV